MSNPAWVVTLSIPKQKRSDTKYVRALTEASAIKTARVHSTLPNFAQAYARLATPRDLGCVPVVMP